MPDVSCSNMRFTSNLQPIGDEEFRDSVFLTKIRDPFALDYMHRQKFKMLPVQEEEYQKASGHCSYAFDKDFPWGTVLDEEGHERLVCRCQNMQCAHFKSCNPDFEVGDLYALLENEVNAFLKYSSDDRARRERQNYRKTIRTQELEEAYRQVLSAPAEEKPEDEKPEAVAVQDAEKEKRTAEQPVSAEASDDFVEEIPDDAAEGEMVLDDSTMPHIPKVEYLKVAPEQKSAVQAEGFGRFVHAEYEDVLNAGPQDRMLVNAGPGTGKTWTLIHKIAALVQNEDIEPEDVLVLSFSRAAVEEIEKRLKAAEVDPETGLSSRWHRIDFSTLDSFATRMILYAMQNEPDLLPKGYSLVGQDYDARIETARQIIRKSPDILDSNIHVLIDEIQDLVGCRAKLVLDILHVLSPECGFTLLGDACQSLYDYQAEIDKSILSSAQFYDILFKDFPDIRYYRFDVNHRQNEWLRDLITPYRDAILTGTPQDRRDMVFKIRKQILDSMIDLKDPDPDKISYLTKAGPVAILTRSNGEALKISEYLKSAGISHRLERPDSEEQMNDWIAAVFTQYPQEMINKEQFIACCEKLKPDLKGASVESCWNALLENVPEEGPWYHVSTILETLLRRGKNRALFRNSHEETSLTVSNIHRAKGKEYDTVLVPAYSLDSLITEEKDQINEHKVCYVACTRPKKALKTAKLKKEYVSRDKSTGRCFEGRLKYWKKGQKYLAYVEVGLPGDIDVMSLANEQTQAYIRDELNVDDRIVMIKMMQEDGSARYSIRPEKEPEKVIGYASAAFVRELGRYECLLTHRRHFDPVYYPSELDNIVVTKKTSCIVTGDAKREGMRYYGDTGIWFGFAVTGFAHTIMNRY